MDGRQELSYTMMKQRQTFADITTNNIGNTIGIYLNDEMIANPRVMCAITEGSCQIEVDTYEQAQVLSEALEKCK